MLERPHTRLSHLRRDCCERLPDEIPSSPLDPLLDPETLLLATVYFAIFRTQTVYDAEVRFGGDIWEYQSMAVNFAKGHGVNKFGGSYEEWETYRFTTWDKQTLEQKRSEYMQL